jgi:hypothetical protein
MFKKRYADMLERCHVFGIVKSTKLFLKITLSLAETVAYFIGSPATWLDNACTNQTHNERSHSS